MKVMISQPMRGVPQKEIEERRADAIRYLEGLGHEVVDTMFSDGKPGNALACLARSLETMSRCDGVYFLSGWEGSRGCCIEMDAALRYGKWVLEDEE